MVMSRGATPWAFLSSSRSSPLERASAVEMLGGSGTGVDLSSAFSLGSGAADTGTGVGSSELQAGMMGDDDADLSNISPLLIAMAQQQMGVVDDSPTAEDKGLALAQAGFATAAGESRDPLANLGAGAVSGIQALQRMRQQRAIQRMREGMAGQQTLLGAARLQQQQLNQKALADARRVDDERAERIFAENKRQHEERIAAQLAGRDADIQQSDVFLMPDGSRVKARFNKAAGEYEYKTADGWAPLPPEATPTTPGVGAPLQRRAYETAREEFRETNSALKRLDKYFGTVQSADQGWRLIADKVVGNVNTYFKNNNMTPEQFATLESPAQLQALLGLFRTDIVGPGVMTEYDAQRVLAALGGDISALRNKEVVAKVMKDLFDSKRTRAELQRENLLYSAPVYGDKPDEFIIYTPQNLNKVGKPEDEEDADGSDDDSLINKYLNP